MHGEMKLLVTIASTLIVFGFASAGLAGALLTTSTDPSAYTFVPGDDGRLHLAILKGNFTKRPKFETSDVSFHLYTRSNPDYAVEMFVGDMNGAPYDPNKPTMFIVHGYMSDALKAWVIDIKYRYLSVGDYNVIAVDWSDAANNLLYNLAKDNVKPTGQYLGEFMTFLSSEGASLANMHCTGHSLGAHVCGHAGEALTGQLGRVTGMDPAMPLFDYDDMSDRLDASDALFVDVIHTCGGWLGFMRPIGHADFYPNGGNNQPGCDFDLTGKCNHDRSHDFFAESIISSDFRALLCDSWDNFQAGSCNSNQAVPMGEPAPTSSRGTFYLATAEQEPFALG